MRVTFARASRVDLEDIARYLWERNPRAAVGIADGLVESCYALQDMPFRYPLLPRRERQGVRRRRHGNYLIFFRVRDDGVEILHILHGAMDYEKILDADI